MEVKNPVTASVRTTVRTGIELFTIAFAIILPLVVQLLHRWIQIYLCGRYLFVEQLAHWFGGVFVGSPFGL